VTDAKIFTDTFKIRDHVELWSATDHTRDGYFELISEEQMLSKDYAGIYARHLHMEPVVPECSNYKAGSQLWLRDPKQALNVITTSTFGGFGWVHHDVYVQTEATLAPGYASLGRDGNCYEQFAGILKMQELRLDKGAQIKVSLGDRTPAASRIVRHDCPNGGLYRLGEYADLIDVDSILLHGDVFIDPVIRAEGVEIGDGGRCFPIIRFKSVSEFGLNNLKLKKYYLSPDDHPSIERRYALSFNVDMECGIVSLCVVPETGPIVMRRITIPEVAGVTTTPPAGIHFINSHHDFKFSVLFPTLRPLRVSTDRVLKVEGGQELVEGELKGVPNAGGKYEYVIRDVRQDVQVFIGPEYTANETAEDSRVWAHRNMVYFRMDREDMASIYLTDGRLVKRIEVSEGLTTLAMERGLYIITLKDGSVHKVIVK
ncbi:MAG: hypothetical protein LBD27_02470, partial [Tannerella sp.]|nr:hypothetical protein [Tannerella sp.]